VHLDRPADAVVAPDLAAVLHVAEAVAALALRHADAQMRAEPPQDDAELVVAVARPVDALQAHEAAA
jgi:hypothetical protein